MNSLLFMNDCYGRGKQLCQLVGFKPIKMASLINHTRTVYLWLAKLALTPQLLHLCCTVYMHLFGYLVEYIHDVCVGSTTHASRIFVNLNIVRCTPIYWSWSCLLFHLRWLLGTGRHQWAQTAWFQEMQLTISKDVYVVYSDTTSATQGVHT